MSVGNARLHIMFTRDMVAAFPTDPTQRVTLARPSSNPNLTYHGGLIQTAPKIYVIFWGSAWNGSGDPNGMASYLVNFLKAAAGSKWLNSVTQYTQSGGQHVGNSGITVSSWTDTGSTPPSRPAQSDLASEATRGAAHFGDYSASASYIVVSPHGIKPQGFVSQYCAWHSSTSTSGGTIAYTNLPYIPDGSWHCGYGSVNNPGALDGVSIVGGHEQAETETDPQLDAWYDSSGAENADKCAWTDLINNPNAGGYPTQPLWSNASSSCVQSY
jgi:serine protease